MEPVPAARRYVADLSTETFHDRWSGDVCPDLEKLVRSGSFAGAVMASVWAFVSCPETGRSVRYPDSWLAIVTPYENGGTLDSPRVNGASSAGDRNCR